MIGRTISRYKIIEKIGEGGMGVVYKAEDIRLKRTVALKFLAAHLLTNDEEKARFTREAQAAAALDHPNICTVHEIDEAEGRTFIAMAFIKGRALSEMIAAGPLKLPDALDIALQAARGLEAAHRKKVVHRDVKPANLMVTGESASDRLIKIMDFGLAQLADRSKLTQTDTMLGTVAYMSPEQTYGTEIDHRTDIWSLGAVIYEMVTGQQAFQGHYEKAIIYSITAEEPEPMTGLRTGVPMELEWIVGKCLAKGAHDRYQNAGELIVDLRTLQKKLESGKSTILRPSASTPPNAGVQTGAPPAPGSPTPSASEDAGPIGTASKAAPLSQYRVIETLESGEEEVAYRGEDVSNKRSVTISVVPESAVRQAQRRRRFQKIATGAMAALLIAAAALLAFEWLGAPRRSEPAALRKFAIAQQSPVRSPVISPDGRYIAFVENRQAGGGPGRGFGEGGPLMILDLQQGAPRAIDGSSGARDPFWSADSQFVGFFVERELKRVVLRGGTVTKICDTTGPGSGGGTWSADGQSIVFAMGGPPKLYQVPARGGAPQLLASPDDSPGRSRAFLSPHFLPAESPVPSLLMTAGTRSQGEVVLLNLETRAQEKLVEGTAPFYSSTGHILYQTAFREGDLWAIPFSITTLKVTGEPFPVAQNSVSPSVAGDGTLVYLSLPARGEEQLVLVSRSGEKLGPIGQPQLQIAEPAWSPGGDRILVRGWEQDREASDIWIHEITRPVKTRVTFDSANNATPVWGASENELAYIVRDQGNFEIVAGSTDGRAEPQKMLTLSRNGFISDWSADGRHLFYAMAGGETNFDISYIEHKPGSADFEESSFLETRFHELAAVLSPDGKFVAYSSDESGRFEVYVQTFPQPGGKWQISTNGGAQPRWSRSGTELFYVEQDALMRVPVSTEGSFSPGAPQQLFRHPNLRAGRLPIPRYDVAPDGARFVIAEEIPSEDLRPPVIQVVQNWFAEFEDRQR